ncbi:3-ketoacyl-CoA synthase 7 [Prunus yedoensis var. nudiflora]|uniref:3-ketoacyl-CoA synthase n=1 Tax=Prunus yedoensis var. nudiflora TaxID=2094558 RepID=A0A314YZB8_PRUYE|nr:3-ketoacyl-CoA synthase 7 [Prunus yedoensis var. nudiflora]
METALLRSFSSIIPESPISLTHFLAATVLIIVVLCFTFRPKNTYLIDFTCYLPPESLRIAKESYIEHIETSKLYDKETYSFQVKVLERSGIGEESCVPIALHELPPHSSLDAARKETEMPFCPTPSITSMVINKFGFRSNIKSVNLSGMGCSAGILSISLAKDLLKVHQNSLALVLSMEAVTPNGYMGTKKSMLLPNLLFRMGGAAILLSSRKRDKRTAKYELQHIVRTHIGLDDEAYQSVFQQLDEAGHVGVSLSRALIPVATKALRTNISKLGPLVLPYSEQLRYVWSIIHKKVLLLPSQKKIYAPNFKRALQHFCIHAGGRAVIDGIVDSLRLDKEDGEASRMTLHRFGNTSSSSIWYELCYLEAKGRMKKGNLVWQIAFGSGFKCNSAIWKCISDIDPTERNAWSDRTYLYPIEEVPK